MLSSDKPFIKRYSMDEKCGNISIGNAEPLSFEILSATDAAIPAGDYLRAGAGLINLRPDPHIFMIEKAPNQVSLAKNPYGGLSAQSLVQDSLHHFLRRELHVQALLRKKPLSCAIHKTAVPS